MASFALTVGRNEEGRYLRDMLANTRAFVDTHFFYDDQSADQTPIIAEKMGCTVVRRPDDVPAFMEHEGRFRAAAWRAFEAAIDPRAGDWVLVVDTDEFFYAPRPIGTLVVDDPATDPTAVMVPFAEVFGWGADGPLRRIDGLWGSVCGPRLFPYRPNNHFDDTKSMGSASNPSYVNVGRSTRVTDVGMVHFGYAREEDQAAKYARYASLANHGHDPSHIHSILHGQRELVPVQPWPGLLACPPRRP